MHVAIDRGGTFTDFISRYHVTFSFAGRHMDRLSILSENTTINVVRHFRQSEVVMTMKLPSVDTRYDDAPSHGIAMLLDAFEQTFETISQQSDCIKTLRLEHHFDSKSAIPINNIASIRMGTTVATNALLERTGAKVALFVTAGFEDLISIGTQARMQLFNLDIEKPSMLCSHVVGVRERVVVESEHGKHLSQGSTVVIQLDESQVRDELSRVFELGFRSIAVSLLHSHKADHHERTVQGIANQFAFENVSISSQLMPMAGYLMRTSSTILDAYLTPCINEYLSAFRKRFERQLDGIPLYFMQSDGGLTSAQNFRGFRAVLSGPAGGVIGCNVAVKQSCGQLVPSVGFDMGGTSTDITRLDGSCDIDVTMESTIAGVHILAPQVSVDTVAAGGGSIIQWKNGFFSVGPQSAGAVPGPMCYGRGGPLTVTDANLMLGRLVPDFFPCVFGLDGRSQLSTAVVECAFEELAVCITRETGRQWNAIQVALACIRVANESMCRPIRQITEMKGYRASDHVLVPFGGAAGQHAVSVARSLGMDKIIINERAGILSAVGIAGASKAMDDTKHFGQCLSDTALTTALISLQLLRDVHVSKLNTGECLPTFESTLFLRLRYEGTSSSFMLPVQRVKYPSAETPDCLTLEAILQTFQNLYLRIFGFAPDRNEAVFITDVRCRTQQVIATFQEHSLCESGSTETLWLIDPVPLKKVQCYFDSTVVETPVYHCESAPKFRTSGPALLMQNGSTVVVDPGVQAEVMYGSIVLTNVLASAPVARCEDGAAHPSRIAWDPLLLSLFSHRFMSIAEQMGRALQRTAMSTNIRERLDFSCALFDVNGRLVANAPHIPVHLGAMGESVRHQQRLLGDSWGFDDVVVCNHPAHGGSHLPDITVISKGYVVSGIEKKLAFFVASRAHHADIGGLTPGSMPPFGRELTEEGAIIASHFLVKDGRFDEAGITQLLMAPSKIPGCAGSRALKEALSDLKAQVAANAKGISLLKELIHRDYNGDAAVVVSYMGHIQAASRSAVESLLASVAEAKVASGSTRDSGGSISFSAKDFMDDGSPIDLRVRIETGEHGARAVMDFSNSAPAVQGNTNCPTTVVRSAVLYAIRCLIHGSVPLNEGCLDPIEILVRPGSILAPPKTAAVVAGNVLTSQRITDVILYAFGAAACSQGDMNNLTFGCEDFAYYETIGGGAGATPRRQGASAVHTHMTNTRITDPEVLEMRFPVILAAFAVRRGSGGKGHHQGGDGIVRRIIFLHPQLTYCMLSERRALRPRGLRGGGDAQCGWNLLHRLDKQPSHESDLWHFVAQALRSTWTSLDIMRTSVKYDASDPFVWEMAEEPLGDPGVHYVMMNLGARASITVRPGDVATVLTPGGGAYGICD